MNIFSFIRFHECRIYFENDKIKTNKINVNMTGPKPILL